ncbi:uncharacterized protein LOC125495720 [Beta vulgaris subsp. vulgaris]|uniref:uncharacterized protein LOC125495720 n=1 Tax=Beta vulgaris subsp. vulgaris TaxID=3555 RepID=UPI0020372637|nr:uncharacterized protein LOC125495720 [Beta vulgaris subsp. vulgaris]
MQNNIYSICDKEGNWADKPDMIQKAFLEYYLQLLGTTMENRKLVVQEIIDLGNCVENEDHEGLITPILPEEVKQAMFSIPGDKSPGSDGFGSHFFRDNWELTGDQVTQAVTSFFHSGTILKEINATVLALIPKCKVPNSVVDFRPIACCNVIYKVISKVLCMSLSPILPKIVADNQGAFIQGRNIVNNIMICQYLLKGYGRKGCRPNCLIKMDMRKAYDTIEWNFVREMMTSLKFPQKFIDWGEFVSTYMLMQWFKLFSDASGLCVNKNKTAVYTAGMEEEEVKRILDVSGFVQGQLPFTYLGMHICSSRISNAACNALCDKMISRIKIWSSRHLSYAARVQLSGEYYSTKPGNVDWNTTCLPKRAGGLDFRRIEKWNQAALGKLIWAIAKKEDTLWIRWVNGVYVQNADWWTYKAPSNASWYWKCICDVKDKIKASIDIPVFMQIQRYQISKIYKLLVGEHPRCFWDKLVWCRLAIPKHNLICWLAVRMRIYTKDRLKQWRIIDDDECSICQTQVETHNHLLFQCEFSTRLMQLVLSWLKLKWVDRTRIIWYKMIGRRKCSGFQRKVYTATLNATVYAIWHTRNDAVWNAKVNNPRHVYDKIRRDVICRIKAYSFTKINSKDSVWWESLCSSV